ncbi:hypothetical protein PRIPAC_88487 [Pristionchus pacificus]|nr:hypothetical protein PRIPAC_88487 [Pristionchus pacificus]
MVGRSLFALLLLLSSLVVADPTTALLDEATVSAGVSGETTAANGSSSAAPDAPTTSSPANSTVSETPAPSTEKAPTSEPTADPTTTTKSTTTTTTAAPTTSTATAEPEPTSTTAKSTSASSPTMPSTVTTSSPSPRTTTTEDPPSISLYQMSTQQICDKSRREYSFPTFVKKMNVDKRKQSRKTMAYFAGTLYTIHGLFVIYILSLHFHSLFRRSGSAPTHVNTSVPSARVGEMSEQAPPSIVMEPIQT